MRLVIMMLAVLLVPTLPSQAAGDPRMRVVRALDRDSLLLRAPAQRPPLVAHIHAAHAGRHLHTRRGLKPRKL